MGANEEEKFLGGLGEGLEGEWNDRPHAGGETERPTTERWPNPGEKRNAIKQNIVATLLCIFYFKDSQSLSVLTF